MSNAGAKTRTDLVAATGTNKRRARKQPPARATLAHRLAVKAAGAAIRRRRSFAAQGRIKVTILLMSAYDGGGVVRSVMNLAEHLAQGHDVKIVSVLRKRKHPWFPFPPGVQVTVLDDRTKAAPAGPRGWARWIVRRFRSRLLHPADTYVVSADLWSDLALVRYLRRVRSGIVIATRPSFGFLGAEIARPGVAVIAQEHLNLAWRRAAMQPDIRRAVARLDAVAVLTEADRRAYEALDGDTRIVCIPNGIPSPQGRPAVLSVPVAIAAGRLKWQKGFDMLVRAFAQLAPQEPEWTLKICGRGPLRTQLRELAGECGVAERVLLPRDVRDMEAEMERASMFVLSSRFEGFPMVLLEAMSKGLPVVAFDCQTGPAELVEDGVTGLLVPDGDVDALAQAMLELMRDEAKRRRFGAAALERAQQYTLDRTGTQWDALLAEVAAGARIE